MKKILIILLVCVASIGYAQDIELEHDSAYNVIDGDSLVYYFLPDSLASFSWEHIVWDNYYYVIFNDLLTYKYIEVESVNDTVVIRLNCIDEIRTLKDGSVEIRTTYKHTPEDF